MAREKEEEKEFKGFGVIDLDNLEREAARHSKRAEDYGLMKEEAQSDLVDAENELELVKAELYLKVIRRPEKYDLPAKPTVGTIDATIILDEEFQTAQKKRDRAKRRVATLAVAMNALEHRKKMIEKFADLFQSKYRSIPRTKTTEEQEKKSDREVADRVQRRRRE